MTVEPTRKYADWLCEMLPDLRDADDWDDAFGYVNVWVREFDAPEFNVLVHVIAPGAAHDLAENTGWIAV